MPLNDEPQVLRPFHRSEVLSIEQAAVLACRSRRTIRDWCARFDVGRRIQGRWAVSKVALAMLLDGNKAALLKYLAGDRSCSVLIDYFERCDVPLPKGRDQDLLGVNATRSYAGRAL